MATITGVKLSKVQLSAQKAANVARAAKAYFNACADYKEFHNSNQSGEYGSGGSIYDPGASQQRKDDLAADLDNDEGLIKEQTISREDMAGVVALTFETETFATPFFRELVQRCAG